MRRRNFFAVLFAPLLARFAPKPRAPLISEHDISYSCVRGTGFVTTGERWASTGECYSYFLDADGDWMLNGITSHHSRPPFVKIDIPERWPWEVE